MKMVPGLLDQRFNEIFNHYYSRASPMTPKEKKESREAMFHLFMAGAMSVYATLDTCLEMVKTGQYTVEQADEVKGQIDNELRVYFTKTIRNSKG